MRLKINFLILFFFYFIDALPQEPDTAVLPDILKLSLYDLKNIEVSTGSKNILPINESPNIISVITENEIRNSGAKDLHDILKFIPGFDFGTEWDNIIGIGVRGNNATEGKFLIQMNGHHLNETNFGIFPFTNHIPVDNIERIEIVRGPGSVIYGGSAELAVINIITKNGKDIQGIDLSTEYSYSDRNILRYNFQSTFGNRLKNGLEYSISAYYGKANRSNRIITTYDTTEINYKDSSDIKTIQLNLNLNYKSLYTCVLYDRFLSDNTEGTGQILFESIYTNVEYDFKLNNKMTIRPGINWKMQKPWYFISFSEKEFYNSVNNRINGNIHCAYSFNKNLNIAAGAETYIDQSKKTTDTVVFSSTNDRVIRFNNYAVYTELIIKSKLLNIAAGARFDYHSEFYDAFVPRIALIRQFNIFNFKLIYSKAYKAPTISNLEYNSNIKPERTEVIEFEARLQLSDDMNMSVNLYNIKINDPILYIPNPLTGADYYTNFDITGTKGLECSYRINQNWGYFIFSYSYYEKNKNRISAYEIEGKPKTFGAFPRHKASLNSSIIVTDNLLINYSLLLYGERYTYIHTNKQWSEAKLITYKESYLLNLFLIYKNIFKSKLEIKIGVCDITNQKYEFINAYRGWQNQIPAAGRELSVKLLYNIDL